jgi:hypothetical protein
LDLLKEIVAGEQKDIHLLRFSPGLREQTKILASALRVAVECSACVLAGAIAVELAPWVVVTIVALYI